MFADDERDELEGPADLEPDDSQFVEPGDAASASTSGPDVEKDDTGEFLEGAPPLDEPVVPVSAEPPDEDAVEDWVTVEMPRSKGNGPGEAPDERTPPEEITPVDELPKAPGAGVVVEPASPAASEPDAPEPPRPEPAAEKLDAPAPPIEVAPEPAPPPPASVQPAAGPSPPPAAPPVVPPKPAEPAASPVVPAKPVEPAPVPPAASVAPAASVPPVSAVPVEQPFMGPVGRGLSGVGIRDRRAQQWVTAGLAAVLVACCTCTCMLGVVVASLSATGG